MKIVDILLLVLLLPIVPSSSSTGTISGRVVDQKGNPVSAVTVWVDPQDGKVRGSALIERLTNEQGLFSFEQLNFGSYRIFTRKEDAGYPNEYFSFYSHTYKNKSSSTVVLTPDKPVANVSLTLGQKAALLTGSITNATTGSPVSATFVLRLVADPDDWISVQQSSPFHILIPPNQDVSLEVSAQGYKPWRLSEARNGSGSTVLHLRSNQERNLNIHLEPQ